jgi:hypothetical protein
VRFEMRTQGAAPRHLRVVAAPEEEEEEVAPTGWAMEVTHSARGGMGRRVEVSAAAIARRRPRLVRRSPPFTPSGVEGPMRAASGLALSIVPPPPEPDPSPHDRGFGYGSRPGRDMPLVLSRDWR